MKGPSELCDLLERDGQRHSFSKVMAFGALVIVGLTVPPVLVLGVLRGWHFGMWDVAALVILPLIPHAYGLATKAMRLKWERPQ